MLPNASFLHTLVTAIEGKLKSLFSSLSKLRAPLGMKNKRTSTYYVDLRGKSGALGENGEKCVSGLPQNPKCTPKIDIILHYRGWGNSRFILLSMQTVYSCIIHYCIIFSTNNCKPPLLHPVCPFVTEPPILD